MAEQEPLYPKLKTYMQNAWMKYFLKNGGAVHVRDFAIECKVSDTNMGRYLVGTQMPSPAAQDKIAIITGPGIYEACDAPMRIPKNKLLLDIVMDFAELNKDEQKDIRNLAREYADRNRRKTPTREDAEKLS